MQPTNHVQFVLINHLILVEKAFETFANDQVILHVVFEDSTLRFFFIHFSLFKKYKNYLLDCSIEVVELLHLIIDFDVHVAEDFVHNLLVVV